MPRSSATPTRRRDGRRRRRARTEVTMTAIAPPVASAQRVRARPDRGRQGWVRRAPLLPALVFTIIVTQLPFLLTLWYSLQSWSLVRPGSEHFVGFANYADVFQDSQFWTAALNTVIMTVGSVLIAMLIGIGLALILDRKFLGRGVVLGAIYLVNEFDAVYMMTQGGPGVSSTNLPFYIYQRAFLGFEVGQAAAMGVIVVIMTIIVATFALRLIFTSFSGTEQAA